MKYVPTVAIVAFGVYIVEDILGCMLMRSMTPRMIYIHVQKILNANV